MRSTIRPLTRVARVAACVALLNLSVPGGAIVSFGLPAKAAVEATLAARAKAARDMEARRRQSASRLLTHDEEAKLQGKTGENPYLAGQSKWDVVYKGIDLFTGNYSTSATDMSFDGGYGIPVNVTRSYSANDADEGPFGKGWTLSADVRSTAGGLIKSGSAPVRSIPLSLKERSDAESDPNVSVQPAQAVTAVDAGGTEETVQKDVDGILTTPAWDKNVYDSVYEWVTLNGSQYQVLVSNTVKTPEGTVYTYAKQGTYPNGTVPWNQPGATAQAANVLKVTTATDRQGNVTTYSYGGGTVTFNHSNGTTVEHPLTGISMPGGHYMSLNWGTNPNAASYMRLTSVSDGTGGRTVSYGYTGQPGHGLLASVTSAGGKTTQYGYGGPYVSSDWQGEIATNLLTTITDPRGLTETVRYLMGNVPHKPDNTNLPGAIAYGLVHANGTQTYVSNNNFHAQGAPAYGYDLPPGTPQGSYWIPGGIRILYYDTLGGDTPYFQGVIVTSSVQSDGTFAVDLNQGDATYTASAGSISGTYALLSRKEYAVADENLMRELHRDKPWESSDLPAQRGMSRSNWNALQTATGKTYNFMGQPLTSTTVETWIGVTANSGGYPQNVDKRTATVGYAYWGADKYWQLKATRDQAGRYSFTDYYTNLAPAGKRGQTYRVYDPKYGGIGLNTGATLPGYATADTAWRYQVTPTAGQHATQFDYDAQGRPIDVWKLQANSSPYRYVRTHTSYGGDGAPSWGQASSVVEDYGGVNRTTTTQAYTSWGKARDVIDAAGHEFVTDFDLDGKISSVTRKDGGLNQTIISYAYGSSGVENGQPTSVTDGLSGVTQTIAYCQSVSGVGMLAGVTETNGSDAYTTSYTYNAAGDRATATYATPSGTVRWGYGDYHWVGNLAAPSRAFQTLVRLDGAGNRTAEEFQYGYDTDGALLEATFAQSPYVDGSHQPYAPAAGGAWYDTSHPASRRARTHVDHDAGGRTLSTATYWDAMADGGSSYAAPVGIASNVCGYEVATGLNRGLKTSSAFTMANVGMTGYDTRTETYGYDAALDQLTSASYSDGLPNASATWSYDAAGNRNDAVTDNLNRATSLGGVACTNDILGNRIAKGGTTYGWDCQNRLISVSGSVAATYVYRSNGMRVSKQTGGVTTLYRYNGQLGIEDMEVPASGAATVTRYGLGARGIDMIERANGSGTITAFPIYDAHGNNVASLTRNGTGGFSIGDRRSYDAWGVVRAQQSGGDPKLRYCASLGHKTDDESGLIFMRSRYYDPNSGRFVSEDDNMSGRNWFAYADSCPTTRIDRSGHEGEEIAEAAAKLAELTESVTQMFELLIGAHVLVNLYKVGSYGYHHPDTYDNAKGITAIIGIVLLATMATVACGAMVAAAAAAGLAGGIVLLAVAATITICCELAADDLVEEACKPKEGE